MVDALALRADERRDKLRKASGRSKYPLIRRSLNGEALRSPGSMDNISPEIVARIAEEIAQAHRAGVQIGLVVGGGNF